MLELRLVRCAEEQNPEPWQNNYTLKIVGTSRRILRATYQVLVVVPPALTLVEFLQHWLQEELQSASQNTSSTAQPLMP